MRMPFTMGHHNWTYRLLTGRAASNSSLVAQLASLGISAYVIGVAGTSQPALAAEPLLAAVTPGEDSNDNGPIVTIIQPSYSALLKGKEQIIIGVQARKYPPKAVEMYIDDVMSTKGAVPIESLPQAAYDWDTTKLADGPHVLRVSVTDSQGYIGQAEVRIYVNNSNKHDTIAPVMDWLGLRSGEVLRGKVNIELKAVDNFGVKYIFVFLNPAATPKKRPALRSWLLNHPPYSIPFDTLGVADGMYVLDALALDPLENEGTASTLYLGVANHTINPVESWMQDLKNLAQSDPTPVPTPAPLVAAPAPTPYVAAPPVREVLPPQTHNPDQGVENPVAKVPFAQAPATVPDAQAPQEQNPDLSATQTKGAHTVLSPGDNRVSSPGTGAARTAADRVGQRVSAPRLVPRAMPRPLPGLGLGLVPHPAKIPTRPATVASLPKPDLDLTPPDLTTAGKPAGEFTGAFVTPLTPARTRASLSARAVRSTVPTASGNASASTPRVESVPLLSASIPDVNAFTGAFSAPRRTTPRGSGTAQSAPRPSSPRTVMLPSALPQRSTNPAAITVTPLAHTALSAVYVTQRDESLLAVAHRSKLPVAALAAANGWAPTARLRKGAHVRLPQSLALSYHGQPVQSDVASLMVGSTAMAPFRFLFQQQGGTLVWDGARQRVVARDAKHEVVITIGSRTALVNKKEAMMNLAAFLMSGRTMVPVRFFETALHAQVEWEPSTGRLFVAMAD